MDKIVGRVVGVVLNNSRGLDMAGHDQKVHHESFFARIAGFDVFGVWAESRYKGLRTNVYFPWGNIKSIIFFPEKTDLLAPDEGGKCLGFGCQPGAVAAHNGASKNGASKNGHRRRAVRRSPRRRAKRR